MIRFSWFIKSCQWEDKPTLNSKLSKSTPHQVGIASAPWITVADWGLLSHSVPGDFVPPTVLPLKPWHCETPRCHMPNPKTLGVCRRAQCNSQGAALARQHGHQRDIYKHLIYNPTTIQYPKSIQNSGFCLKTTQFQWPHHSHQQGALTAHPIPGLLRHK